MTREETAFSTTNSERGAALEEKVAVVGMSCRFPGASNIEEFWANLEQGRCAARHLDAETLVRTGVSGDLSAHPSYVPIAYPIDHPENFDAAFFGISDTEAQLLDPQHRIFLEQAHAALDDAGFRPGSYESGTGVYAGSSLSTYLLFNLLHNHDWARPSQSLGYLLANDKDYLASRVAYKLNLQGPAMSIQTACSSSLVAICQAVNGLLSFDCDVALAGGSSVRVPHEAGYIHEPGGVFSPDGLCRSFDQSGAGTVFGNGVGVVVLKRLVDAVADKDMIYAVISGTAVTNDGSSKVGFAAPNIEGQANAISNAISLAGIDPAEIGMLEMHGTATQIGDPIEVAAAKKAFREYTQEQQFCAIGSVKSNVGHLDCAAGVASFMKAVLSVDRGIIPKTLHFETENPKLGLKGSPFRVAAERQVWSDEKARRVAGVSSFGMGGTNAHIIVEQWGDTKPMSRTEPDPTEIGPTVLALSAESEASLKQLACSYESYFSQKETVTAPVRAICVSAGVSRRHYKKRKAFLVEHYGDVPGRLREWIDAADKGIQHSPAGKIAFLFPGQGSSHNLMGQDWMRSSRHYRDVIGRLDDMLGELGEAPFLASAFESGAIRSGWEIPVQLFAHQYALTEVWRAFGIQPDMVLGHSLGEIAAALVAGIIDLPQALKFVVRRSQLMEAGTEPGSMLSVRCDEVQLRKLIEAAAQQVEISGVNADNLYTVSGGSEAIAILEKQCRSANVAVMALPVPYACHSRYMDPIMEEIGNAAGEVTFSPPAIPLISSMTGALEVDQIQSASYWQSQIRQAVNFRGAADTLLNAAGENCTFVEIGCGTTLLSLCRLAGKRQHLYLPSQRGHQDSYGSLLEHLATLYEAGHEIDWQGLADGDILPRVRIPGYAFDQVRHWIEPPKDTSSQNVSKVRLPVQDVINAGLIAAELPAAGMDISKLGSRYELALEVSIAALVRAFSQLGAFNDGQTTSLEDLTKQMALHDDFNGLLPNWLSILENANLITSEHGAYQANTPFELEAAESAFQAILRRLDTGDGYFRYLVNCATDLAAVITGDKPALETLFPNGSFEIVDYLYRLSPEAQYFNTIASQIVARWAERRQGPIRILEIGAGTGGMTAALLPCLPSERTAYHFTDLSEFFFKMAKNRFQEYDFLHYATYNADNDEGDLPDLSFDLIVASNVLHATPHLQRTMGNVTKRLAPGGLLLVNEVTENQPWFDVTVALIEGWRVYDDGIRTEGGPLVSVPVWQSMLASHGFEHCTSFPENGNPAELMGQHIIAAFKPGDLALQFEAIHPGSGASQPTQKPMPAFGQATEEDKLVLKQMFGLGEGARRDFIIEYLAAMLPDQEELDLDAGFFDMGLDSLQAVDIRARISAELQIALPTTALFDYPNPRKLIQFILSCLSDQQHLGSRATTQEVLSDIDLMRELEAALADAEDTA
tara:strand:+ start:14316 stop:18620 length:4305 start_codon:yes stop_codon:yes gene_type:complete